MYQTKEIHGKDCGAYIIRNEIMQSISQGVRNVLLKIHPEILDLVEEIRMRAEKPLMIHNYSGDWFVAHDGRLSKTPDRSYIVSQYEILRTLELMSENSIYAYQDEIRNGYITLKGGHRVGIIGKAVMDGEKVKNIKDISSLNIRVSREVIGCAEKMMEYIVNGRNRVYNTLIISPPQCGKTTMLRDIARLLSDGMERPPFDGVKVGIVDERSEIAACYRGIPQNRVGLRTDVLDGCPKYIGMDIMLRSMSPQVIITDEIGNRGDGDAIMRVINAGVKIIASAHGYNISELKSRREVINLMEEKVFERYIVLSNTSGPGTLEEIVDGLKMQKIPVAG